MTKTQTWAAVQELPEFAKASKALKEALELVLAPKSSSSTNPPKVDKDGNPIELYCRFHEQYEPVENMVMSGGKSKGYCRASISKWNKTNAQIKKLNEQIVCALDEDQMEDAQKLNKDVKALKSQLNDPEFYDFKKDWADFNATTTKADETK